MDRFEARTAIVNDLRAEGLLVKEEPYRHAVGHCDRCGTIVEPLMSEQWFVAMTKVYGEGRNGPRSLAGDALKAVESGWTNAAGKTTRIKIVPERHLKVYTNWLENIRDWTISRQLWWGHRIPVWYCDTCGLMTVAIDDPTQCSHCGSQHIHQDEDTLDTWFSSALWPFSTLGWPDETEDLKRFYPTSVMETGYDIIFLWVARMIMMGLFALDDIPFEWVYFHGTVRDDQGQRMSKSKGNGVDPEMLINRYGSDAVRFKLITAGGTGNDQRLEEPRMEAARNFANKLWNASRFVLSQLGPDEKVALPDVSKKASMPAEDRWIMSRLEALAGNADRLMERFELGEAGRQMEEFVWDEFCDWYLEIAKIRLRSGDEASPIPVLVYALDSALRLLHPYMPYVTEEIWSGSGDVRNHLQDAGLRDDHDGSVPARDAVVARRRGRARDGPRARRGARGAQPAPRTRPGRSTLARSLRGRGRVAGQARAGDRDPGAGAAAARRAEPRRRACGVGGVGDSAGRAGHPAARGAVRRLGRALEAREGPRRDAEADRGAGEPALEPEVHRRGAREGGRRAQGAARIGAVEARGHRGATEGTLLIGLSHEATSGSTNP